MNNSPILKLNGVSFTYKRRNGLLSYKKYTAINNIDFEILNGETVGILGRNGAGKSTLLQLIAGILEPSSGSVTSDRNLSISLLKLKLGFTPMLNGRENAIMSAMLLGHTKEEAFNRLDAIIAFSGLNEWIDEPVGAYSTGMKARLGFSVALQLSPDILLVDEVLGVGDEVFKRKSVKAMKSKIGSKSQTVVLVSHSIPTLRDLCDRIVWIDNGIIKATGKPNEIISLYMKNP